MAYAQITLRHKDDPEKILKAELGIYWPSVIAMIYVPQLVLTTIAMLVLSTSGMIDLVHLVFYFTLFIVFSMVSVFVPIIYERYRENNNFNKKLLCSYHFWVSLILFFSSAFMIWFVGKWSVYLVMFLLLSLYNKHNLSKAFKAGYVVKKIKLTKSKNILNSKLNISNEVSLDNIENKLKKIRENSIPKKDKKF